MIVVTGSNGFIGSNLIKGLNNLGHTDIIAIDDHSNPKLKENIAHCEIADYLEFQESYVDYLQHQWLIPHGLSIQYSIIYIP